MRQITMMQAQFQAHSQSGEALRFDRCKGGYFSILDDYGLKITGTEKDFLCVRAGTRVNVCGKNLFDIDDFELINLKNQSASYEPKVIDGIIYGGGRYGMYAGRSVRIPVLPGETVTLSGTVVGKNMILGVSDSDAADGVFSTILDVSVGKGEKMQVTITAAKRFTGIAWWADDATVHSCGLKDLQMEIGTAPTAYEPYLSVSTCTIPCDLYDGDCFWPVTGKAVRRDGTVEQYESQPIQALPGISNVIQRAVELPGNLSATMLVRR